MNQDYNTDFFQKLERDEISKEDFNQFQIALRSRPELRQQYRQYMRMKSHLVDMAEGLSKEQEVWLDKGRSKTGINIIQFSGWIAAAAAILIMLNLPQTPATVETDTQPNKEETTRGVAIITDAVDVKWIGNSHQTGQAIGLHPIEIESGILKIEFYCGATVVLEGPAKLEPQSAWKTICHSGKLRAHVPPAARGFTVLIDETEVVDLGTEFAIDASGIDKKVQVFEGEVELNSDHLKQHSLTTGKAIQINSQGQALAYQSISQDFIGMNTLKTIRDKKDLEHYQNWHEYSLRLSQDPRLLAYYTFTQDDFHRRVLKNSTHHGKERSGAIVGADRETGRWSNKSALSFKQPGDRVRINIPDDYQSLTFMCWVKIYSLDRDWNSLYLTDNYQLGECHWQIMRDGRLMFSTKIRDDFDKVKKASVHEPSFSPSFWKPELRGKWVHLAARLDLETQALTHFFNGKALSHHPFEKDYHQSFTRFGNGEIGNWGLPNKPDDYYAIRNLNGAIDEFAIFSGALSDEEILEFYEKGNPYQ